MTQCLHCHQPLGDGHRAVTAWFAGRVHHGRVCEECWSRTLLGSLLYRADVCGRDPCDCGGWCADLAAGRKLKTEVPS